MIGIIAISLSILVMLGGLMLLSKAKKDSLGNLFIFSSYSAIALGAIMFVGTIVGGACMMRSNCSKSNHSCYQGAHGSACGSAASCTSGGHHFNGQCGSLKGHGSFKGHGGSCGQGGSYHGKSADYHKKSCSSKCSGECEHGKAHKSGADCKYKLKDGEKRKEKTIIKEIEVEEEA